MPAAIDVPVGTRFGRLVTTGEPYAVKGAYVESYRFVNARCDCGTEMRFIVRNLRRGNTTSCGCLRSERGAATARLRAGIAVNGNCGAAGCNGNHGHDSKSEMCPAAWARKVQGVRDWYQKTIEARRAYNNFNPERRIAQMNNQRKRQLSGS